MKKILLFICVVVAITAIALFSFLKGVDKMRDGLVANYPTVKNILQGATTEFFDSTLVTSITKTDNEALFNLLKGDLKADTLQLSIPYYGRYGIDLSIRNFRVFRKKKTVEVWLPDSKLLYCELKFEGMMVNGKTAVTAINGNDYALLKKEMYEVLIPVLDKNKSNKKAAKKTVAKALMFYFMPYRLDLKLYIDNELQTLPQVPGVNETVDEAIHQMLTK